MDKELNLKYKRDFKKVSLIVNEFDFCGLIKGGAPIDEYDCLTSQVLNSFYKKRPHLEIRELIIHEIEDHFGSHGIDEIKEPFKTKLYSTLDAFLNRIDLELEVNQNIKTDK
jgi:hypothetical protein